MAECEFCGRCSTTVIRIRFEGEDCRACYECRGELSEINDFKHPDQDY